MISFGLIVVETAEDAEQTLSAGAFDFSFEKAECANCGMVIGSIPNDNFLPCAVIFSSDTGDAWQVCFDCAAPLIFPGDWVIEFGN